MLTPTAGPGPVVAGLRQSPGVVAAVVFDRASGRYLLTEQPDRPFQAASLVKLLIALDVLTTQPPDDRTRADLHTMLAVSDDAIASRYWSRGGGAAIVRRVAAALTLTAAPPQPERLWGYTSITARDVLAIYRHITDHLAPAGRDLILDALRSAPHTAADGHDQHFGLPDALPGRPTATKQGWSSGHGLVAVHSTGLVGPGDRHIVVLLTEHPARVGWPAAMRQATADAAQLAPLLPRE